MKGLLIKDFKLMKVQRNFFLILIAIAVWMSISMEDSLFVIGYMTFLGSFFTVSSINYDEFENGYAFLFTLPITRKAYVAEKYGFGLILVGGSWLAAVIITLIVQVVKNSLEVKETLITALMIVPIILLILAVMLPIQLKFGSEKGRIAILIASGLICLLSFAVYKITSSLKIDMSSTFNRLSTMNIGMLITAAIVTAVLVMLLSYTISISVMKKKEF